MAAPSAGFASVVAAARAVPVASMLGVTLGYISPQCSRGSPGRRPRSPARAPRALLRELATAAPAGGHPAAPHASPRLAEQPACVVGAACASAPCHPERPTDGPRAPRPHTPCCGSDTRARARPGRRRGRPRRRPPRARRACRPSARTPPAWRASWLRRAPLPSPVPSAAIVCAGRARQAARVPAGRATASVGCSGAAQRATRPRRAAPPGPQPAGPGLLRCQAARRRRPASATTVHGGHPSWVVAAQSCLPF